MSNTPFVKCCFNIFIYMKGTKTYIYGIYKDNAPIYVGKSSKPYERYKEHCSRGHAGDYCKILDIYFDLENKWIKKFWSEGYRLKNKITHTDSENWKVGDIIVKNI